MVCEGPAKDGAEIVAFETVLTPGMPEKNTPRLVYLWPGVTDQSKSPNGDLVQTTIMAYSENRFRCNAKPTQWCVNPTTQHGLKSTS